MSDIQTLYEIKYINPGKKLSDMQMKTVVYRDLRHFDTFREKEGLSIRPIKVKYDRPLTDAEIHRLAQEHRNLETKQ